MTKVLCYHSVHYKAEIRIDKNIKEKPCFEWLDCFKQLNNVNKIDKNVIRNYLLFQNLYNYCVGSFCIKKVYSNEKEDLSYYNNFSNTRLLKKNQKTQNKEVNQKQTWLVEIKLYFYENKGDAEKKFKNNIK